MMSLFFIGFIIGVNIWLYWKAPFLGAVLTVLMVFGALPSWVRVPLLVGLFLGFN
jgi:hypothetical protein